ncbi:hypothetical protein [Pseudomonas sp.]|uniref:hypothetical protein n=1 Tax=Pseudomonas sp. TaxID=306 RepID=UPI003C721DAE
MLRQCCRVGLCALVWLPGLALALEVGLVTGLSGAVVLSGPQQAESRALQAFSKLHDGDRLILPEQARLQLVLFHSGEEQVWQGPGELQVRSAGITAQSAALQPQVRQLPKVLVKQLAKTPAPDGQVKAGMVRLRSMPSGGTLESLEKNYAQQRKAALATDRNPELYLLAGYFELREFDLLQQLLTRMEKKSPGDKEVALLRSLYLRAVNNAKMAAEP